MWRIAPEFCRSEEPGAFTYPETPTGFSQERWNAYRALFQELRLQLGVKSHRPHSETAVESVTMIASGLSRSGKGYVWAKNQLAPLVKRLDGVSLNVPTKINGDFKAYRLIEPGWYLFYEEYG